MVPRLLQVFPSLQVFKCWAFFRSVLKDIKVFGYTLSGYEKGICKRAKQLQKGHAGECRCDHGPDKAQRRVISAPTFFQCLTIVNKLFKTTEFNFLSSLPPMGRRKVSAKKTRGAESSCTGSYSTFKLFNRDFSAITLPQSDEGTGPEGQEAV